VARRGHGEGSIYKGPEGRWRAVVDLGQMGGKRQRKYLSGKTRREVQLKLTAALRDHQQGLPLAPERQTLEHFLTRWSPRGSRPRPLRTCTGCCTARFEMPYAGTSPRATCATWWTRRVCPVGGNSGWTSTRRGSCSPPRQAIPSRRYSYWRSPRGCVRASYSDSNGRTWT
jgi:hypothetical protein